LELTREEELVQRRQITTLARFATVGVGLTFGLYFVFTSPFRHDPLWLVWAPLVIAFTGAAGAVFFYGMARWTELARSGQASVSIRDAAIRVTPIGILIIFVLAWAPWLPAPMHFTLRFAALIAVPLVGGIPTAGAMECIRQVAKRQPATRTRGEQAALLVSLRQLLQRLLAALGSLVALSTLALGPSVHLLRDLAENPHFRVSELPPQFVLVFGGLGSLLVALYYAPAATALQRRGQRLCNDLFPLAEADEAAAILAAAEDRHKLEQLLGVDRSVAADLQTGLVILGPLLASAATAFLSP
jgi:hypothetical protein